jgi:Sen15 protein
MFGLAKGWYNVELLPVEKLETVFISGHPSRTEEVCLVWPVSATASLSMRQIKSVMEELQGDYSTSRLAFFSVVTIKYI